MSAEVKAVQIEVLLTQSMLYGVYATIPEIKVGKKAIGGLAGFLGKASTALGLVDVDQIGAEIIPKTIGFCGLVGSGLADIDELSPLMQVVSIAYLLDQTTDNAADPTIYLPAIMSLVNDQPGSLSVMANEAIADFPPHYQSQIRKLAFRDVSLQEFDMRRHSIAYFGNPNPEYLVKNCPEIVEEIITDGGLELVAFGTYMLLEKKGLVSTPLDELREKNARLINRLNGFLRMCDDYGDREADLGSNINIFNPEGEQLIEGFCKTCDIDPRDYLANRDPLILFKSFYRGTLSEIMALGGYPQAGDEGIYLTLLLRVMEGGFVNILGDKFLTAGNNDLVAEEIKRILEFFGYKID